MNFPFPKTYDERRRVVEFAVILLCAVLLIAISRLEVRLFSLGELLSANREFFTTLVYFALINLNVILILILSFLIFRNLTKLVLERRRGMLGSKLRSKLVVSLVFFALAPTLLLFYVTTQFIMTSFETWFSEKVQTTIQKTQEAGSHIYKQDQKRLASLARIALQRVVLQGPAEIFADENTVIDAKALTGFDTDYGLNSLRIYGIDGSIIWASDKSDKEGAGYFSTGGVYPRDVIRLFLREPDLKSHSRVVGEEGQDVVLGGAPLREPSNQRLLAVVIAEVRFETQILKSVEQILADFADIKPGANLIRLSYMITIVMIVLLIVFSASWLGFYVAREITGPIQNLAEATREVALGNYSVNLQASSDDEAGQLVNSFNSMTRDLRDQRKVTELAQAHLQASNEELDQKRQYLEIVLKHIAAGVIALDSRQRVTSVNAAAEKILKVKATDLIGHHAQIGFGQELYEAFWQPLVEGLADSGSFHGQVELSKIGRELTLIVNALRLHDENDVEMGYVIVFDDALAKLRAQRVLAWREVARRIAHEIKNPITPIKLNAQRLVRKFHDRFEEKDQEIFETCMETIVTQVDSLRDLVNEFTKFSKLPSINPKPEDVGTVVADAVKLFRMSYGDIDFEVLGTEGLPRFPVDKEQLNRALVNILGNAVSSLQEGRKGRIEVRCQFLNDLKLVRIEVADNGCGVPNELKERVLEPYFSTKDEGTGLGLAIVHQIITDHGGYLRLTDNHPQGTVIIIELPIA
ncbi:MAG: HAMP domain-containing protein [Deltaproteobacteria bacterium]|nr:HAMP domain-containing protein [Deltaproteobacteria bacterium]